jgi:hypothetical protein
MWCPTDSLITYGNWITNITKQLLETLQGFCKSLLLVAENKVKIYYKYYILKFNIFIQIFDIN